MQYKYDVLCIGQMGADILVRPVPQDLFSLDSNRVEPIVLWTGGDAQNQAVVLSKLGMQVALIGKIGQDDWGDFMLRIARERGVCTEHVIRDASLPSATSVVLIRADGQRNFLHHGGSSDTLCLAEIDLSLIGQARMLSFGSLFSMPGLMDGGFAALARAARQAGTPVCADTAQVPKGVTMSDIAPILSQLNYFLPSYEEASVLAQCTDPAEIAAALATVCPGVVIVKHGADGCYVNDGAQAFHVPAFAVHAVDTTGAGDNFVGGFLYASLQGLELSACVQYACATGAISVQSVGTTTGLRDAAQVEDFLRAHA